MSLRRQKSWPPSQTTIYQSSLQALCNAVITVQVDIYQSTCVFMLYCCMFMVYYCVITLYSSLNDSKGEMQGFIKSVIM